MRLVSLSTHPDIPLDGRLRVVGRHRSCDLRVESERISRRHCLLALQDDSLLVLDLGSTNGTRVNGRKVIEAHLRPGDILELAHLAYRLDPEASPDRPAEPPPPPPAGDVGTELETDPIDMPPT